MPSDYDDDEPTLTQRPTLKMPYMPLELEAALWRQEWHTGESAPTDKPELEDS